MVEKYKHGDDIYFYADWCHFRGATVRFHMPSTQWYQVTNLDRLIFMLDHFKTEKEVEDYMGATADVPPSFFHKDGIKLQLESIALNARTWMEARFPTINMVRDAGWLEEELEDDLQSLLDGPSD